MWAARAGCGLALSPFRSSSHWIIPCPLSVPSPSVRSSKPFILCALPVPLDRILRSETEHRPETKRKPANYERRAHRLYPMVRRCYTKGHNDVPITRSPRHRQSRIDTVCGGCVRGCSFERERLLRTSRGLVAPKVDAGLTVRDTSRGTRRFKHSQQWQ